MAVLRATAYNLKNAGARLYDTTKDGMATYNFSRGYIAVEVQRIDKHFLRGSD